MATMKRQNRGKKFEAEIEEAFQRVHGVSIDRLPDPMGGYSGVKNICDYHAFHAPNEFYIECKCHYGNTLNYKSDIRVNQWDGLTEKSQIPYCVAGVAVWFIDYDLTVFVNITDLNEHRKTHKSLNINDVMGVNAIPHFVINGAKKRTMFKYDGEDFLNKLHKLSNKIWGEFKVNE